MAPSARPGGSVRPHGASGEKTALCAANSAQLLVEFGGLVGLVIGLVGLVAGWAADVGVAGHVEAVRELFALADREADARGDAGRAGGGVPSSTMRSGPRSRLVPSKERSTANAWPSRPGTGGEVAVARSP